MRKLIALVLIFFTCSSLYSQTDLQTMLDTEKEFDQTAVKKGIKQAFTEFLSDDSIIFRPEAVNGKEFWKIHDNPASMELVRKTTDSDIASNGMMGYTTGNWRLYPKGKSESAAQFGQYVTIWEKRMDGKFYATVDIGITHEKLSFVDRDRRFYFAKMSDPNQRGWSPADASMNFLRMSMTSEGLSGAYKKYAADEIRLLIESEPPILGRKKVVSEMKRYISISFPRKVASLQAADMAYVWNPCNYANSIEGVESGNCLQIWKLRKKKWWIVLSVFARVENQTLPTLKARQKSGLTQILSPH